MGPGTASPPTRIPDPAPLDTPSGGASCCRGFSGHSLTGAGESGIFSTYAPQMGDYTHPTRANWPKGQGAKVRV